jgi:hypothetical protein
MNRTRVGQPVAHRYTDWAIPTPIFVHRKQNNLQKTFISINQIGIKTN